MAPKSEPVVVAPKGDAAGAAPNIVLAGAPNADCAAAVPKTKQNIPYII